MSFLRNITSGLRSLFRKDQVDRELDEELRAYQKMATEEKMRQGMSRNQALRAVRLKRGNLDYPPARSSGLGQSRASQADFHERAVKSFLGNHVHLRDFFSLHRAGDHDTQPPAGSHDYPHGPLTGMPQLR